MPLEIMPEVTQFDIDNGDRKNCEWCPVARAIRKATRKAMPHSGVSVDAGCAYIRPNLDRIAFLVIRLPQSATTFIADFDAGRPVNPFSFPLTIPDLDQPTNQGA